MTFHGGTETGTDLSLCHLLRIFHLCSIAQYSPWVGYVGRARQDAVRTARDIGTACGRQVGPSQPALAQELAQPAQSGQRPLLQRTLHHTMRRICRAHVGLHICRRSRLQVGSARPDCMLEARRPFLLSDPNFFLNLTVTAPCHCPPAHGSSRRLTASRLRTKGSHFCVLGRGGECRTV